MSLSVQSLSKSYGNQKALDEVSFSVNKGEILGFLGPNGAGKSTTLKIITGIIQADSGKVEVCGIDVAANPIDTKKKTGYLAEQNPLYPDMYVREFLEFMGNLSGLKGTILRTRIQEMIALTGLGAEQHKKIGALSKGYRQRVGLAQAMLHGPEILILDEPTSGLDPNQMLEIRNVIRNYGKEKTLIFSSHILPEVQAIADRIIIIHQGKIVADRKVQESIPTQDAQILVRVDFESSTKVFNPENLKIAFPGLTIQQENQLTWTFSNAPDAELRKAIYAESVQQDIPILSLKKEQSGLEELFRSLTQNKN
jgi:ABC-2 type transport system ATP-binding protein